MKSEWSRRLERRFGSWAFPQLAAFIVFMNAAVWMLTLIKPQFPAVLVLVPELVLRGQVWRLFTFLFIPPAMSPIATFFWLYLLFIYAQALEAEWGDFQFNLFYAIGAAATLAASFYLGAGLTNIYLNASLFLAFAALFPEFELLLFFIVPVKIKWLAALAGVMMAWNFLGGDAVDRWAVASGLFNCGVFFGPELWEHAQHRVAVWRNRKRFRSRSKEE